MYKYVYLFDGEWIVYKDSPYTDGIEVPTERDAIELVELKNQEDKENEKY